MGGVLKPAHDVTHIYDELQQQRHLERKTIGAKLQFLALTKKGALNTLVTNSQKELKKLNTQTPLKKSFIYILKKINIVRQCKGLGVLRSVITSVRLTP